MSPTSAAGGEIWWWWHLESKLASARRSRRAALAPSCALSERHFGTGLGALRSHRPAVGQSVRRAMRRAEGPSTLRRLSAQSGRLRAWTAPLRRSRAQELRAAQRAAQRDVAHSAGTHAHGLALLPRTASYGLKTTHQHARISAHGRACGRGPWRPCAANDRRSRGPKHRSGPARNLSTFKSRRASRRDVRRLVTPRPCSRPWPRTLWWASPTPS